jgi:hypothetical protein
MILTAARIDGPGDIAASVVGFLDEAAVSVGSVLVGVLRYSAEHPLVIALVVAIIGVVALRPRHTPR